MIKLKIKAPSNNLELKQYILSDFIPEFSQFGREEDKIIYSYDFEGENYFKLEKKFGTLFKEKKPICPKCGSKNIVENGKISRKLYFLVKGEKTVFVQEYKCKECGKKFSTDLSSFVKPNSNITLPVIEFIRDEYAFYGASLHSIRESLFKHHKIDISYQSIENIILSSKKDIKFKNWSLSGYYLFDSLWVKNNGKWNYLLVLFDTGLNTIVSYKLVLKEDIKTIHDFLNESLANQPKKCITTDLKLEYRRAIDKINIKHHFCKFHTKQKINRDIRNHLKKNKVSEEELDIIKSFKQDIFDILDSKTIENAEKIRDNFFKLNKDLPEVIFQIVWDLVIPDFKKLTWSILDDKIEETNNKIENSFLKILPKNIKRRLKSEIGILARFSIKIDIWNSHNANF